MEKILIVSRIVEHAGLLNRLQRVRCDDSIKGLESWKKF